MDLFLKAESINHIMFHCEKCEVCTIEKDIFKIFVEHVPVMYRADIIIETIGTFHSLLHADSATKRDFLIYKHSNFMEPIHKTLMRIEKDWAIELRTLMEDIIEERYFFF